MIKISLRTLKSSFEHFKSYNLWNLFLVDIRDVRGPGQGGGGHAGRQRPHLRPQEEEEGREGGLLMNINLTDLPFIYLFI